MGAGPPVRYRPASHSGPAPLRLTTMTSPLQYLLAESPPIHASPAATYHDVGDDEFDDDGEGASSEVSEGGNLRVRNFPQSSAVKHFSQTSATLSTTSKVSLEVTLISRENSPSMKLSPRHPSPVYT